MVALSNVRKSYRRNKEVYTIYGLLLFFIILSTVLDLSLIHIYNGEKISEMIKGPLQKARQLCAKCPFNSCTSRI